MTLLKPIQVNRAKNLTQKQASEMTAFKGCQAKVVHLALIG